MTHWLRLHAIPDPSWPRSVNSQSKRVSRPMFSILKTQKKLGRIKWAKPGAKGHTFSASHTGVFGGKFFGRAEEGRPHTYDEQGVGWVTINFRRYSPSTAQGCHPTCRLRGTPRLIPTPTPPHPTVLDAFFFLSTATLTLAQCSMLGLRIRHPAHIAYRQEFGAITTRSLEQISACEGYVVFRQGSLL